MLQTHTTTAFSRGYDLSPPRGWKNPNTS